MGEAKRRKKLDPSYGDDNFELKFLSEKESKAIAKNKKRIKRFCS